MAAPAAEANGGSDTDARKASDNSSAGIPVAKAISAQKTPLGIRR